MPNVTHPLLMEDANTEAPVQEEAATLEENLAALSEPVAEVVAEPAPAEEEEFYRISRSDAYKELSRLEKEDPNFRNVLNSLVGRKAAREYKPKINDLEAKLAQAEAFRIQSQKRALEAEREADPEGFAQKVVSDPRYRQLLDAKAPDPREVETRGHFEAAIETALDAVADVISPVELEQFHSAMRSGWYDFERDQQGNPGRKLAPQESLARFQGDLYRFAMQSRPAAATAAKAAVPTPVPAAPTPAPVAEVEKPKPNMTLAQATPDLTPSSGGTGGQRRKYKMSEVKAMSRDEKGRIWPGLNDFGRAYAAGEIEMDV